MAKKGASKARRQRREADATIEKRKRDHMRISAACQSDLQHVVARSHSTRCYVNNPLTIDRTVRKYAKRWGVN